MIKTSPEHGSARIVAHALGCGIALGLCQDRAMADDSHRWITIDRLDEGVYLARNRRGLELRFGSKDPEGFTPVELLLAAIAGCSADTALRDISELLARGVLRKSAAGGRSTSYELNANGRR
jgi:Fic family protein